MPDSYEFLKAHFDRIQARQIAARVELLASTKELRINANRLCDRQLGGSYEDDCRRSIARVDAAIRAMESERDV